MSNDSDLMKLYSARILELTVDIPHDARLADPQASAKRRAPLCGSTVSVDIIVKNGRITDFGQDVKACALGQAAASILGENVIGRSRDEMQIARDQLRAMLAENGPVPAAPFDGLEVLIPARDFKNRHASIQLAFDATLDAFDQLT